MPTWFWYAQIKQSFPNIIHGGVNPRLLFPVVKILYEVPKKDVEAEDFVEGAVFTLQIPDDRFQRPAHLVVTRVVEGAVEAVVDDPVQRLKQIT